MFHMNESIHYVKTLKCKTFYETAVLTNLIKNAISEKWEEAEKKEWFIQVGHVVPAISANAPPPTIATFPPGVKSRRKE